MQNRLSTGSGNQLQVVRLSSVCEWPFTESAQRTALRRNRGMSPLLSVIVHSVVGKCFKINKVSMCPARKREIYLSG